MKEDIYKIIWVSSKTIQEIMRVDKENAIKIAKQLPSNKQAEALNFIENEYNHEHDKEVYYDNIEKITGYKKEMFTKGLEDAPYPRQGDDK